MLNYYINLTRHMEQRIHEACEARMIEQMKHRRLKLKYAILKKELHRAQKSANKWRRRFQRRAPMNCPKCGEIMLWVPIYNWWVCPLRHCTGKVSR